MPIKKSWQIVTGHYDKIGAFVVVAGLVASLLYLAVRVGMIPVDKRKFSSDLDSLRPRHKKATPEQTGDFQRALEGIKSPLVVKYPSWTNTEVTSMFVPEWRVWCVDCRRPIGYHETVCPYCETAQPPPRDEDDTLDTDGDGIPDMWERNHGMDSRDPSDVDKDNDADGFTNREEYLAKPQTDPQDPDSSPEYEVKLRLVRIVPDPFHLRFKTVSRVGTRTEYDLPKGTRIKLPDNRELTAGLRCTFRFVKAGTALPKGPDGKEYPSLPLPAKTVVTLPPAKGEPFTLTEGAVMVLPTNTTYDIEGKTQEELDAMPIPMQTRIQVTDKEMAPLPEGCVLKLTDGRQMTLPKGSAMELPRKQLIELPDVRLSHLPKGLLLRGMSSMGRTMAQATLGDGVQVVYPDETAQKLEGPAVLRLGYGLKFQINLRGNERSFFVNLGEAVEGFTLYQYEPSFTEQTTSAGKRLVDTSILTLRRGEKNIPLVLGRRVQYNEYTAHLRFVVDNSEYALKINQEFSIKPTAEKTLKYRVKAIDMERDVVVLERLNDSKELELRKFPRTAAGEASKRASAQPAQ